ncbi:cGMP-dependent protein kinase 1 [Acipenser oxyrinchus oxyrinchus]|uniref:cGMP-dependent protein kinase n=1 Tax=Acipenser oxyrinchus oxyrinchus TaxID=40147 RepID=A0AAD8GAB9_ACIOX|nr:cGMP-dependent protein kinase 1 [Acipenser oxyrinchus oxyrinchus]
MEVEIQELRLQLKRQCLRNKELEFQIQELEHLLKEKDNLVKDLQARFGVLDIHDEHSSTECDHEVRNSRTAAIAPEPLQEDCDHLAQRIQKSFSETNLIVKAIYQNDFLNRLDDEQINMMVECLCAAEWSQGETVIREGTEGNTLYIVAAGELRVTQGGRVLRTLSQGDVFGELAILYNCKRTATVTAITNVQLWSIERQTYRAIMTNKSKRKRQQIMGFLKTARILKRLSDAQLSKIIDSMDECKFQSKEVIVREATEGKTFFIILKGEVRVTKQLNGQDREIRILGEGDHFGELALIRAICRTATCTAMGPVTCISIDKEVFEETIPFENIELPDDYDIFDKALLAYTKSGVFTNNSRVCIPSRLEELVPVLYQEGQYQGEPVTLGVGGFGRVKLVTTLQNKHYFALKQISKKHIVSKQQQEHVLLERRILQEVQCNFIVRLYTAFKDSRYIYMILEFCPGGELWTKLREERRFEEVIAVFCAACVVEAFAYLHKKLIIYRDLKPENLMLDQHGYIKLVDFGFAKELTRGVKTYSFCGTPEYLAPEIIQNEGHDFAADFWSLGILVYELLSGSPPFSSSDPQKVYSKILDGIITFPHYMEEGARSLISKLCRQRPGQRLGNTKNGIKDIRNHRWFSKINWQKLQAGQIEAPTIPLIRMGSLYINFDRFPPEITKAEEEFSGWDKDF